MTGWSALNDIDFPRTKDAKPKSEEGPPNDIRTYLYLLLLTRQ